MIEVSKLDEVRKSFVTIIRYKQDMEAQAWKLFKHPDSTGEQIMEARRALRGVEEPLGRVITALRKQYPYPTISMVTRPWHRQEYDKYDQAIMGASRAHDSASEEDSTTHEKE